jgi:hypothetical protein
MLRDNLILVFVAAALVCGCEKKKDGEQSSPAASLPKVEKPDPEAVMLGTIDIMMQADSAVSAAIATKGRRAEVRDFAVKTASESHEMHVATEAAAAKSGITPTQPPADPTPGEVALTLSLINGATKNTDIDAIFLAGVVSRNLALENETSYRKFATKDSRLKDFYEKIQATSHARVAAVAALVKKKP